MSKSISKCAVLFLMLVAAFSVSVTAQSLTTGGISGNVTDATGAVIPGAAVNLTSLDTGATQTTTTNQAGDYSFTLLKPGRYQVTVTQAGFSKEQRQIDVALGQ